MEVDQNLAHLTLVWTPRVLILSSRWTLIMAQPYLHALTLILVASMTPRVTILVLSRNPRGCPQPNQRSLLTLSNSMMWSRALPQTTTLINLTIIGLPLAEPRNILINQNINLCPDIYLRPQRRISPLSSDIGLQNLLGRPTLIKTILNPDPDPPYYREVALSDIPAQYAKEVDTFRCILKLPDPRDFCCGSWALTMIKAGRSSGQEALPLCCL